MTSSEIESFNRAIFYSEIEKIVKKSLPFKKSTRPKELHRRYKPLKTSFSTA